MNDQLIKDRVVFDRCGLLLAWSVWLVIAGCASTTPAPVAVERPPSVTAPVAAPGMYLVKKGDTLHSIALDHGLDYRELIAWNTIENPNRILVGQSLRIRAPGSPAAGETAVVRPVTGGSLGESRALGTTAASSAGGVKREPKAGKEPYSGQALARAQAQAVDPVIVAPAVARVEPRPEVKPDLKPEAGDAAPGGEEIAWIWPANGKLVGTFSDGGNKGIDISGKAGEAVLAAGGGKVVYSGTGLRGYGKLVIVKHNNAYLTAYAHNRNVLVKEGESVGKGQKIAEMGNTDADQVKLHFEIRRQGKPVDPLKYLPPR
ncbi:MAG: peptidoglycan DD-metalloendopeptidase family protein [Candidatus Accumulibacter sp. UW26]|jgi:lipoprotein NlpD